MNLQSKIMVFLLIVLGIVFFPFYFILLGYLIGSKYFAKKRKKRNLNKFDSFLLAIVYIYISIAIIPIGFFNLGFGVAYKQLKEKQKTELRLYEH